MTYLESTSCLSFYVPPFSPVDLEPLNSTDRPLSPHSSDDFHSSTNFTTAGNIPTFHVTRTTSNEAATGLSSDLDTFLLQPIPQNPTSEPHPTSLEKETPTSDDETHSPQSIQPIAMKLTKKRYALSGLTEEDYETIRTTTEESKTLTIAASRLHMWTRTLKRILSEKFPHLLQKFRRKSRNASEQQLEQIKQLYSCGYNAYQISAMTHIEPYVCTYQIEQIEKDTHRTLAPPSDIPHFSSDPITTEPTTTYHDTRTIPNVTATGLSSDLDTFLLQPIPQNTTSEPQPISVEKENPTTDETRSSQPTVPISVELTQKNYDFAKFSEDDYETIRKITDESESLQEAASKLRMRHHRLKIILLEKFPHLLEKFYRTSKDASEPQIEQIKQLYSYGYTAYQISAMTNIKIGVCIHQIAQIEKNTRRTLASPSDIPYFSSTSIATESTTTYHNTRTIPNVTATDLSSDLSTFLFQPIPQNPTSELQPISVEKENPTTDETRSSQPTVPISIRLTQKRHNFAKLSEDDYEKIRKTTEESKSLREAESKLHMGYRRLKIILSAKFPHLLERFCRTDKDVSEQQIEQIRQLYSRGYTPDQISAMTNIKISVCIHQIKQIEKGI